MDPDAGPVQVYLSLFSLLYGIFTQPIVGFVVPRRLRIPSGRRSIYWAWTWVYYSWFPNCHIVLDSYYPPSETFLTPTVLHHSFVWQRRASIPLFHRLFWLHQPLLFAVSLFCATMTANDMASPSAHMQQSPQQRSYASFSLKSRRSSVNVSGFDTSDNKSTAVRKSSKRESRLGLKNIFGRYKQSNGDQDQLTPLGPDQRASIVRLQAANPSRSPYANQQISSESTVSTTSLSNSRHSESSSMNNSRSFGSLGRSTTRRNATFYEDSQPSAEYPPLFQAYPQAMQQATLSATTIAADLLLQQKNEKNANSEHTQSEPLKHDKLRRRHSKNGRTALQWTTKIYLLTSTGAILQYGAHSHYSSPPEKVLKLSDASAAFVTDVIPGQHWVLQVSSDVNQAETEVNSETSRSLFSKLTQGSPDSHLASNMLLVFEDAAEMDIWIALIRGEIDRLKTKREAHTIFAKRSSSLGALDQSPALELCQWEESNCEDPDNTVTMANFENRKDQSTDDTSTTNSVASQDDRQLDNLRESTTRLSLASSGQRTMLSSPSTSPTMHNLSPKSDEPHSLQAGDAYMSLKSRPNAAIISHRRASMQAGGVYNMGDDTAVRRHERSQSATHILSRTLSLSHETQYVHPKSASHSRSSTLSQEIPDITPNFSVPTSSNRRFSYTHSRSRSTSSEISIPPSPPSAKPPTPHSAKPIPPQRVPRGKPPTSLKSSRPLSMVADQPSPQPVVGARPSTSRGEMRIEGSELQLRSKPFDASPHKPMPSEDDVPIPRLRTPAAHSARNGKTLSRKKSTIGLVLRHGQSVANDGEASSDHTTRTLIDAPVLTWNDQKRGRRVSTNPNVQESNRISLRPPSRNQLWSDATASRTPPPMAPPPSGPLPPLPVNARLQDRMIPRRLQTHKSMPYIRERGLPPGPPPSFDLPPVPQR